MFPIALAVSNLFDKSEETSNKKIRNFRVSLFLGIAYASSIGGMATIIGTPPNAAAVGILNKTFGREISFTDWMLYGLPFSLLLLFLAYWAMTNFIFPLKNEKFDKGRDFILEELSKMGKWKTNEKRILCVLSFAIALWLSEGVIRSFYPSYPISDVWIAMAAGIALFLLPGEESKPILNWEDTRNLPWGILLMFGGGLSLAMAFKESGTLKLLTDSLAVLNYLDDQLYLVLLTGIGLLLTAFMSNLAMVTLFVPVVASLALNKGIDPMYFAIPVTLSASCDFMFPMSTPPNAIAFSSGHIRSKEMLKAGIVLNLISFLLLVIFILIN
jgi:sodium-dependent dicarboxylate transporter 2/3/5